MGKKQRRQPVLALLAVVLWVRFAAHAQEHSHVEDERESDREELLQMRSEHEMNSVNQVDLIMKYSSMKRLMG